VKHFPLNKVLRRLVVIKSSDRAIAPAKWVVEIGLGGVRFYRLRQRDEVWSLSWRSVIGHALVHNARIRNGG